MAGRLISIHLCGQASGPMRTVNAAEAVAHRGIIGDRYYENIGTFSGAQPSGPGREITLIEAEVLAEVGIDGPTARRNLVTEGIALNDLVGKRFFVGDVELKGIRLCHPCAHLDELAGQSLVGRLTDKGGLRADLPSCPT